MLRAIPDRVLYVLLFAAVFAALSWMVPAAYHAIQPADHYIQVQEAAVSVDENDSSVHQIEVVYWSRDGTVVDVRLILERVESDGTRSEVQAWRFETYIPEGAETTTFDRELDEPPDGGAYVYRFDAEFQVAYNVQKSYSYETPTFHIEGTDDDDADRESIPPRIQT